MQLNVLMKLILPLTFVVFGHSVAAQQAVGACDLTIVGDQGSELDEYVDFLESYPEDCPHSSPPIFVCDRSESGTLEAAMEAGFSL